jgi:UPF0716 protein FxsA
MPILAGLVLLVVVEIVVAAAVASWIGVGWTLVALLGMSVLGLVLLRREGARAWRTFSAAVAAGRPPGREALDGVLVLIGALLIILPGFVSDVLGLLCILPPTRRLIGRVLVGWALTRGRATIVRVRSTRGPAGDAGGPDPAGPPASGRVIEGEINPPRD